MNGSARRIAVVSVAAALLHWQPGLALIEIFPLLNERQWCAKPEFLNFRRIALQVGPYGSLGSSACVLSCLHCLRTSP